MFCTQCGSPAAAGARYCAACGTLLTAAQAPAPMTGPVSAGPTPTPQPPAPTAGGPSFTATAELTCLECGYHGQMGVLRVIGPWYSTLWGSAIAIVGILAVLAVVFPVGVFAGLIVGGAVTVVGLGRRRRECLCPQCGRTILELPRGLPTPQ